MSIFSDNSFLVRNSIPKSLVYNVLLSFLIAIGFYFFPAIADDLLFLERAYAKIDVQNHELYSQATPSRIIDYFVNDDGRIANTAFMYLLYLPKFFFFLISWASLLVLFHIGGKLADIRGFKLNILWTAYIVFCFPWTDQMYIGVFQSNYLWPCAMAIILLYSLQCKKTNRYILLLLSVILGAWNEATSIPLFCGLCFGFTFLNSYRKINILFVCTGLIVGISWILFAHSYFSSHAFEGWFASRQWIYLPYILPTLIAACAVALRSLRNSILPSPTIIVYFVISLVSVFIMMKSQFGARVGSFAIITSGILIFQLFKDTKVKYRAISNVLSYLVLLLVLVHSFIVTYLCYKSKAVTDKVIYSYAELINREATDTILVLDIPLRIDAPLLCMQKPYFDWLTHYSNIKRFNYVYGRADELNVKVIPQNVLTALTRNNATIIPGTARLKLVDKYLIGPANLGSVKCLATKLRGKERMEDYYTVNIVNGHDTIAWYYPEHTSISTFMSQSLEKADTIP